MNFDHLKDDVLTLLIHLGYLGYDYQNKCVFIPNGEVRSEYVNVLLKNLSNHKAVGQSM